jgi:DNA-binding transcriptional LysR family regulator
VKSSDLVTPEALRLLQTIANAGSFAGAARKLGLVPSALTYRVRQLEETLDVLLFDRTSRKAKFTDAGHELVREASVILNALDAIAQRVKRVATGWESQLTIAVGGLVSESVMLDLCEQFFDLNPPTQLKIRIENLSGAWEAVGSGLADLAIGASDDPTIYSDVTSKPLGDVPFIFAVASHHPLAAANEPLKDAAILAYRSVAVADSARNGPRQTVGVLAGQRVLTVDSIQTKLQAHLRGLGCGYLPLCIAKPYIETGRLMVKKTSRAPRIAKLTYGWRTNDRAAPLGKALAWWVGQLAQPKTRAALLHQAINAQTN